MLSSKSWACAKPQHPPTNTNFKKQRDRLQNSNIGSSLTIVLVLRQDEAIFRHYNNSQYCTVNKKVVSNYSLNFFAAMAVASKISLDALPFPVTLNIVNEMVVTTYNSQVFEEERAELLRYKEEAIQKEREIKTRKHEELKQLRRFVELRLSEIEVFKYFQMNY